MKALLCSVAVLLLAANDSAEEMKTVTISYEGAVVATIRVAQSAKVTKDKAKTVIDSKDLTLDLWVVPKAKSVGAAIDRLDDVIKGEVLKFTATSTETTAVANNEAKHLKGKGLEADDQDPATVDIVAFTVGKTVLVACVHGEGQAAVRQREPMLKALKTIAAP